MKINVISTSGQIGSYELGTQGEGEHDFNWAPSGNLADGVYTIQLFGTDKYGRSIHCYQKK